LHVAQAEDGCQEDYGGEEGAGEAGLGGVAEDNGSSALFSGCVFSVGLVGASGLEMWAWGGLMHNGFFCGCDEMLGGAFFALRLRRGVGCVVVDGFRIGHG
jgi:hypothetical protein